MTFLLIGPWVAGCSQSEEAQAPDPDGAVPGKSEFVQCEEPREASPLPAMSLPPHSEADPPELCEWAASVDALVLGELVHGELTKSPAVVGVHDLELEPQDRWRYEEENCRSISPAIRIEVEVETAFRGEASGTVEARIGLQHRMFLRPLPEWGEDGDTVWRGSTDDERKALCRGQTIGLPLHYLPDHDLYSVMGEMMFGLDAEGRIIIAEGDGFGRAPTEIVGLAVEEFAEAVAACDETEASEARRDLMWRQWGPQGNPPHYYRAAYCNPRTDSDEPDYDAGQLSDAAP